jgi:hypothetical protein
MHRLRGALCAGHRPSGQDGPGQAAPLLSNIFGKGKEPVNHTNKNNISRACRRGSLFFPRFSLLAALVLLLSASLSLAKDPSLEKAVNLSGLSKEWNLEEPIKLYTPDDLFTYINGEAELYFPYGFKELASAYYEKTGSQPPVGLAVDVYRMGSLLDAFGIYAQYRKPENQFLSVGAEGFVNPSQLMFYQDRYFIHLSASGTSEIDRSVFEAYARAVSQNLPPSSAAPQELNLIKVASLIPRTERYYPEGLLGYRFFRHGLIAQAQLEQKKVRFFVLKEDSTESAQKAVHSYGQTLNESGKKIQTLESPSEAKMLFAMDPLHRGLIIGQKNRYVFGIADLDSPSQGVGLIKEILTRLP